MSKKLGRGLEELFDSTRGTVAPTSQNFTMIRIEQVRPSRFQPRSEFREEELEELKASIKRQGVLQPVIVRPLAHGTYELVAGERRWRAARAAGLSEVPAIVKTLSDRDALEYSLVENVQRTDLNPIDQARAYRRLADEFGHTQDQIADGVGKDRATVANMLRLLNLPSEAQDALRAGTITMGHARALLGIEGRERQLQLLQQTTQEKLSVRQLEVLVTSAQPGRRRRTPRTDAQLSALEAQLRQVLGTKVNLIARKKGGRIVIEYFSPQDLARILGALGLSTGA